MRGSGEPEVGAFQPTVYTPPASVEAELFYHHADGGVTTVGSQLS